MPASVTKLSKHAFSYCSSLTTLEGMSDKVKVIGEDCFSSCTSLENLQGLPKKSLREVKMGAFSGCSRLTTVKGFPEGLTSIAPNTFDGCTGLTSLRGLPRSVADVGFRCFEGWTTIGDRAFANCTGLVSIGPGFSPDCDVHYYAFYNCPSLLAAAEAKGFETVITWGKHHWLVVNRRMIVLVGVRKVRTAPLPNHSPLLERIACLPDDLVREVVEFVGAYE